MQVLARMLWNSSLKADDLISEFLQGYCFSKQAAPFIRLYLDTFHGSIADTNFYLHEDVQYNAPFLSKMALLTAAQALKDAVAVVVDSEPQYKRRIDVAKMSVYYVVLLCWQDAREYATNESIAWPMESRIYQGGCIQRILPHLGRDRDIVSERWRAAL